MRRLIFIMPLAAFALVAAWFAVGLNLDPQKIPSALIDRPVPAFTLPPLPDSGVPGLAAEALRGKVSLVNVFASWCLPCKAEHPLLMRLAREGKVTVYGINYKDSAADARKWLGELGNPYAAIGHDEAGRVGIDFGVYGVPETFVIDREGRIRFKQVGPVTADLLNDTLLPLIARLEKS